MSYKPPMGDPAFLQKRSKSSSAAGGPNGKRYDKVEAVVYTGTSSNMMDLVKANEPSVKQQPGELFRRVRPTTVANFVEQQVMEQRRQQYGEGGMLGEDETLAQYRSQIEPLDDHRDLTGQQQQGWGGAGGSAGGHHSPFDNQPVSSHGRRANSSAGGASRRGDGGLLQGPQGGLVYIDRNASGAARPPSRTSTAGDANFYNNNNNANSYGVRAPTSNRTVPNNVVSNLTREERSDPDTVARYNNTITTSLRPDMSDATSRVNGTLLQGPIRRPLPKAPMLSSAQQQRLQQQDTSASSPTTDDGELPLSQREMLILDVRDKDDYDKCHIIGAFHFPQIKLAHATNPYSLPEILRFKNKKNHIIVLYDLEEEITVARKMGNVFFEKGCDNVYIMAGGLRELIQTHNHLVVGECPVAVVAKSTRLGAYGADKSTAGSYANRSVMGGGAVTNAPTGSRAGTGIGGGSGAAITSGRRALSSSRAGGGSTLGGSGRTGLSSSLARQRM